MQNQSTQIYYRITAIVTLPVTILITVLRVILLPALQESGTGLFRLSKSIIAVTLLFVAFAMVMCFLGRKTRTAPVHALPVRLRRAVASGMVMFGGCATGWSLFSMVNWWLASPVDIPNEFVVSSLDSTLYTAVLLSGILGGAFCMWIGVSLFMSGSARSATAFTGVALWVPVLWMWLRLVRAEMSHATAIRVHESFYDFTLLIFLMLFLFAFAKYASGVDNGHSRSRLMMYSACAFTTAASGIIARLVMYSAGESMAYNAGRIAAAPDFFAALLAGCVCVAIAFSPPAAPEPDMDEDEGNKPAHAAIDLDMDAPPPVISDVD